jgi:hypothetical protein
LRFWHGTQRVLGSALSKPVDEIAFGMIDQTHLLYPIRDSGQLLLAGAYRSEAHAKAAVERLKRLAPGGVSPSPKNSFFLSVSPMPIPHALAAKSIY